MPEPDDKTTQTGEQVSPGSGDSPQIDPREYEALRNFAQTVGPIYEKISPYLEDVTRFADDENFRNVAKQSWTAYEAASSANKPEEPEYVKELREGQKTLVSYVDDLKTQTAIGNASRAIESLAQSYPALAENNYALVQELQNEAKEVGIQTMDGFVTYLRKNAPRYFKAAAAEERVEPKTPPRSSRPDGGLPGVPEPKQPVFDGKTARERNAQRKKFIGAALSKAMGGR